jgi:hypothetical protein
LFAGDKKAELYRQRAVRFCSLFEVCSNGSVSADPSVGSAGGLLIGVRLDDLDRCCICGVWCTHYNCELKDKR